MTDVVVVLLALGVIALAVALISSPVETLGWWATWLNPYSEAPPVAPAGAAGDLDGPDAHIVFLAGIGSLSGDELMASERRFLEALEAALPNCRVVRDVFPYSPAGRSLLTGRRLFQWLWRWLQHWRRTGRGTLTFLINLRNLLQVLVAADRRYGPVYGFALAQNVVRHLAGAGYAPGRPVILLGSSGGGQISLGASAYLAAALDAPIGVVTVGGVMASDRGVDYVVRLTSLAGSRDGVYRLGRRAFPGRWRIAARSSWNRARAEGRLVERVIGPMGHAGRGSYLDPETATAAGVPYLHVTVAAVARAVGETLAVTRLVRG
ncbi:MAG: hypothetical protein ACLFU0_06040 [Alphaproteobacteria bacterium]